MKEEVSQNDFDGIIAIELENDELVRLVTSNADVASQYVIFQNSKDEYFAINVAKVEELVEYRMLDIVKTSDINEMIEGTSKMRDNLVNVVHFDRWLGVNKDDGIHRLAMICNYAGVRLAIVIKSVYGVINIEPSEMLDDSDKDKKISYLCEIVIDRKKILCKVFDSDRFLIDVMPSRFEKEADKIKNVSESEKNILNKEILIAEDSCIIQEAITKGLMDKMNFKYQSFMNAKELLDALEYKYIDEIGLIITDLEMPVMGGLELLQRCSEDDRYKNIPIIVNTNMANSSIIHSAKKLGAKDVVRKLDLEILKEVIFKYAIR